MIATGWFPKFGCIALHCVLSFTPLWAKVIVLDASRGQVTIIATTDTARLELADDLLLTWMIEGPAPLKVTLPKSILDPDAAPFWRVKQDRLPEREAIQDGRERWKQVFRLSPFEAGHDIPIALAPFQLQAGSQLEIQVRWPKSGTVEVTTSIIALSRESLRPATEIEPLPPQQPRSKNGFSSLLPLLLVLAVFGALIFSVRHLRRRSRPSGRVYDAHWALAQLQALSPAPPNADVRGSWPVMADILRRFLEFHFHIPATRCSTPELLQQLPGLDPGHSWEKLGQLLDACDRIKFGVYLEQATGMDRFEDFRQWAVQFVELFPAPTSEPK